MPRKVWDAQADWDSEYNLRVDAPRERLGYTRDTMYQPGTRWDQFTPVYTALTQAAGWALDTRILVMGCGHGWGMEALEALGYTAVFGCDNSAHLVAQAINIPDRAALAETLLLTQIAFTNVDDAPTTRRIFRDTGRVLFDVVITERVFESYEDAEVLNIRDLVIADLLAPAGVFAHIISTLDVGADPLARPGSWPAHYNWKELADWKVLLASDICTDSNGATVLL